MNAPQDIPLARNVSRFGRLDLPGARTALMASLGREPTHAELAAKIGVSEADIPVVEAAQKKAITSTATAASTSSSSRRIEPPPRPMNTGTDTRGSALVALPRPAAAGPAACILRRHGAQPARCPMRPDAINPPAGFP